jgi:hypothetical protein
MIILKYIWNKYIWKWECDSFDATAILDEAPCNLLWTPGMDAACNCRARNKTTWESVGLHISEDSNVTITAVRSVCFRTLVNTIICLQALHKAYKFLASWATVRSCRRTGGLYFVELFMKIPELPRGAFCLVLASLAKCAQWPCSPPWIWVWFCFPVGLERSIYSFLSRGFEWPPKLQPPCKTYPVLHPMRRNPEHGCRFFPKPGIYLEVSRSTFLNLLTLEEPLK